LTEISTSTSQSYQAPGPLEAVLIDALFPNLALPVH
jgi:hypothetical protein